MKASYLLVLLMFCGTALFAEPAYRIVHPDGSVEFSDKPREGAQAIDLPKAQAVESPRPSISPPPAAKEPAQKPFKYTTFAIFSPSEDETLRNIGESLTVSMAVEPALAAKHQVVVYFNGKEAAKGSALSYTLKDIHRGTHTLSAVIQDAKGKVVKRSVTITFHVKQFSSLQNKPN